MAKKLVILDRDGVINEDSDNYIKTVEEWMPIKGSIEAIARLSSSGFNVFIATNQSGIGRGYFSVETLNAMHTKMNRLIKRAGGHIEGVFYCPHTPEDACACRKPRPGLLLDIETFSHCSLANAVVVGDSLRDIEAGLAAGCGSTILVKTGKGRKTLEMLQSDKPGLLESITVFETLADVADFIVRENRT